MIPLKNICTHYNAEISFIRSLQEYGLIEITTIERETFLSEEQVKEIEQMIHLHYDLDINIEGIDAIQHLMRRIHAMQSEMNTLRNRLSTYEYDKD